MTLAQKEKYSRVFIWIGLLAWLPYITIRVVGTDISVLPFLSAHLVGVVGGLILRSQAEKGAKPPSVRIIRLKKISTIILLLGVSVWGVYFSLEFITGVERAITPFLIAHLSGVLTGAGIKIYIFMNK